MCNELRKTPCTPGLSQEVTKRGGTLDKCKPIPACVIVDMATLRSLPAQMPLASNLGLSFTALDRERRHIYMSDIFSNEIKNNKQSINT